MDTTLRAASEHASKMMGGALPASKASFHLHMVPGVNNNHVASGVNNHQHADYDRALLSQNDAQCTTQEMSHEHA